ncbi:hypothetical protein EYB26_001044 [Talaromyces marneffei]|uniref:uncharacterized protein n=1 Tax=Talaromyces marneffei TaxID=37727 RepID=UPI0012A896D0|nr:uncharacterized protein EYB26_001044 [Talaromyces marneffei]QGA13395.1 hypothetical protein EYB26_001044 [Talaromyces marneffei]
MITRGKSCLRRGNLSTFLDNVAVPASNEPLQFLYPPFAKIQLIRCPASESRACFSSTRRPRLRRHYNGLQQQSQSVGHKSRRWMTQDSYLARRDDVDGGRVGHRAVISDPELNREAVLNRFDDGYQRTGRLHASPPERKTQLQNESELDNLPDEPVGKEDTENQNVEYENVENEGLDTKPFTIRTVQSNAPSPEERELRSLMRKRDADLARMSAQVNTSALSKKLRYRQFIVSQPKAKFKTLPHWTEFMSRLERMHNETIVTPTKGVRKEILLREETVAFFSGTTRSMENIWYVRIRNGCKVQILDSLESEGIYRKVVLSGTKRVIELVERQFQQYDEQIRQSGLSPVIPSMLALRQQGVTPPLVRRWWFSPPSNDNRTTVSEPVPGTVVNSIRKFNRLVEQWVYYEPPVKDYWHTTRVKDELVDLFTSPGNKLYLSSNALHLALTWLLDHEFLDSARKVFEVAKVVSTTNTFNAFLRATAKRQDPWYFRYVLMEMEKARVQPNGHSWMALLKSLVSPGSRRELMRRMKELGLTKDKRVLHDMIEHDLSLMVSTFLEEGHEIQAFLETLERDYGSDIMTTNLFNEILNAVFLRRDFDLAADILKSYKRFGLAPNARTFTAALPIFYRIDPAVEVITPYLRDHEHLLHHRHYDMLFLDAIASNAINACRVIWRYASMRGETSPTMRYIVLSSLLGKATGKGSKHVINPDHIHHHIGALVIGLVYPQTQPGTKAASLVPQEYQMNPIIYLLRNRDKMSASEKNKLVKALMEDDIERGTQCQPLEPFTVMLDAAVRLDSSPEYSWDRPEEGNHVGMKNLPTIEMLKHVIDVPVEQASQPSADTAGL